MSAMRDDGAPADKGSSGAAPAPRAPRRRRGVAAPRPGDPTSPRPLARICRPAHDTEARRACEDYLHRKGPGLRTAYAALCIAQWIERAGYTALCAADVRALYPRRPGIVATPLRDPAAHLRRASECGLLEPLGDAWYELTALGRAVVEALPDDAQVTALLGRRLPSRVVSRVDA